MKLGLGLYHHQLNPEHYRFARQCGCTHLLLHLPADIRLPRSHLREEPPAIGYAGAAVTDGRDSVWTYEELARLTEEANAVELQVEAVDMLSPAHCLEAVLTSPDPARRMETLKTIIRHVGEAGIPILTCHLAWPAPDRYAVGRAARGEAAAPGLGAPRDGPAGHGGASAPDQGRLKECLEELLTVAARAGVTLALPFHEILLSAPDGNRQAASESAAGKALSSLPRDIWLGLSFDVAETAAAGGNVYTALEACCAQRRLACVRFGNVAAGQGHHRETLVDDGGVDLLRIVRLLQRHGYHGLIVPGNASLLDGSAPWRAGMARTLGFLQEALRGTGT